MPMIHSWRPDLDGELNYVAVLEKLESCFSCHRHFIVYIRPKHEDAIYRNISDSYIAVIEGQLLAELSGRKVALHPGDIVRVPKNLTLFLRAPFGQNQPTTKFITCSAHD